MVAAVLLAVSAPRAEPQAGRAGRPGDTVSVTPGAEYRAGGLHRLFFGGRYRDLWATPIRVPVLDLRRFAGGLRPTRKGGGQQTRSLRFAGADGREYAFRSVYKEATAILPLELRETFVKKLLQDQMSSGHPAGPLVVSSLLEAAGVLHTKPVLVQMPDDPALGEFRSEFAGLLGMIEERPNEMADEGARFAGASEIVGGDGLYKKLDDDPRVPVDSRAFLLARLTDVFLGDWDRHKDQWSWALVGTGASRRWLPIPKDRDQAFVRFDGFLLGQARRATPQLLNFGPSYGDMIGATWNGRDLDRRFLAGLERPVWDSIAGVLKARLTDQAIANAAQQEPPEFRTIDGPRLTAALRARRDHLDEMAGRYYRLLAAQVEIYGSDKVDEAVVTRQPDGATMVTLAHADDQHFQRRFQPGETHEIRIHLQGGGDHFDVVGTGRGSPLIRAIGGGGDDRFNVTRSGGIHLYDDRGTNQAQGAGINRKAWRWKPDSLKPNELPPRDWGKKTILYPTALYGYDIQVLLSYGGFTDWYAFRRVPYSTRLDYRVEFSTGETSGRVTLGLTRQFENSSGFLSIGGKASGIERLRWYGFGNQSTADPDVSYNRVRQYELSGGLNFGVRFGKRNQFTIGPLVRWSETDLGEKRNVGRFIAIDNPYGTGRFGIAGVGAGLVIDGRDYPGFATKGAYLSLQATGYPKLWDADETVGRVDAEGALALAPQGSWRPSLNLSVGAAKTWGKLPFFLAPALGGLRTLRGYRPDRFAGDAAVYGSAELRIPLTRIKFIVPGEQGVFGFADGGRVYVDGVSDGDWHTAVGGGVWLSFLGRNNVLFVGAGKPTKDKEGTRIIVGFGFPY